MFFVRVWAVIDSGSGKADFACKFVVGLRTGEGEWDVWEEAGWMNDDASRSCSDISVDSASEEASVLSSFGRERVCCCSSCSSARVERCCRLRILR